MNKVFHLKYRKKEQYKIGIYSHVCNISKKMYVEEGKAIKKNYFSFKNFSYFSFIFLPCLHLHPCYLFIYRISAFLVSTMFM